MDIRVHTKDEYINKIAYNKHGMIIWSRVDNTKDIEITYTTYNFKNYRYYKDIIHQEDYE